VIGFVGLFFASATGNFDHYGHCFHSAPEQNSKPQPLDASTISTGQRLSCVQGCHGWQRKLILPNDYKYRMDLSAIIQFQFQHELVIHWLFGIQKWNSDSVGADPVNSEFRQRICTNSWILEFCGKRRDLNRITKRDQSSFHTEGCYLENALLDVLLVYEKVLNTSDDSRGLPNKIYK